MADTPTKRTPPRTPQLGRKKPQRSTALVKESVIMVFERLGGVNGYASWARANPDKFYEHYLKLLPAEVKAEVNVTTDFTSILEKARNRVAAGTTEFLERDDSRSISAIDAEFKELSRDGG